MSESAKSHAGSESATEFEKVQKDIAALREDLTRLVKGLAADAKSDVSEETRRLYAKLSDQGQRSAKAIAHEIEERPLMMLLLAFGIGFIGGSLLRR